MEEGDTARVATVFATDAQLDTGASRTALLAGDADQFANALLVQALEGVVIQDLLPHILRQEGAGVVAAEAEAHLREVVGPEAEELGLQGDLIRGDGRAGNLDHGADGTGELDAAFPVHLGDLVEHLSLGVGQLTHGANERDHDFGHGLDAFGGHVQRGFDDGADLHADDFGEGDAQATAPVPHHGIELVKLRHAAFHDAAVHTQDLGHLPLARLILRQELVQGWIQQADVHGQAVHGGEDALEILALHGQQLGQGVLPAFGVGGEDHLAHGEDAIPLEEHVLGAAEADALSPEGSGDGGIVRGVGVGADLHALGRTTPGHDFGETLVELAVLGLQPVVHQHLIDLGGMRTQLAGEHFAGGAIHGNPVLAGLQLPVAHLHDAAHQVDLQGGGAADAGFAHAAGHHGRMAGHATAGREDASGSHHARDVLRAGLDSDQHHGAFLGHLFGGLGGQGDASGGRTRTGVQALGEQLAFCTETILLPGVEDRCQQLGETIGIDPLERRATVDEPFVHEVDGDADPRHGSAFPVAGL